MIGNIISKKANGSHLRETSDSITNYNKLNNKSYHLEESQIRVDNVVEGDVGCKPRVVEMLQR